MPFQQRVLSISKKGTAQTTYVLADRGPRDQVSKGLPHCMLCILHLYAHGHRMLCIIKIYARVGWSPHTLLAAIPLLFFGFHQRATRDHGGRGKGRRMTGGPLHDGSTTTGAQVAKHWVPQLQLEMLAAPAQSALLVSRSATKVIIRNLPYCHTCCSCPRNIQAVNEVVQACRLWVQNASAVLVPFQGLTAFRVWRDDHYIAAMLGFISRLYMQHVLLRRPPPADLHAHLPEYHAFLLRTAAIAGSAEPVLQVPAEQLVNPSEEHLRFL